MGKHFPLNLSKFKKVHEDQHQATLVHPDGHQITIAKKPLSAKLRGQVASLPLADGGEVPPKHVEQTKEDPSDGQVIGYPSSPNGAVAGPTTQYTAKQAPQKMADGGVAGDESATPQLNDLAAQIQAKNPGISIGDAITQAALAQAKTKQFTDQQANQNAQQQALQQSKMTLPTTPQGETGVTPDQGYNPSSAQAAAPGADDSSAPSTDSTPSSQAAPQAQQMPNQAQPDPFGNEAYNNQLLKGLNEQKAGIAGEAQASSAQAGLESKALDQQQVQQQQQLNDYNSHYADLQKEYNNFQQDVQNQHIDPNHYLNSMGTGQRISTAIGLIMGGIGGGLTHQGNPALDFLNKQISNDIASQQSNLGKSENLLNANMRQFGNLRDASQMTMAMQQGIVANQLRQAAAKTTDQMAKSRALQAAGQLDQQAAPVLSQIAMRRTLTSGANAGQIPPENVIRAIVPPNEQAGHYKELQTAQNMSKARDNVLSAYDQTNSMVLGGAFSPNQKSALVEPVLAQLVKDSEGRITPQDTKMIESLFPKWNDTDDARILKRNQLNKFVSEKMNFPMLKAIGINTDNMGRYDPHGRPRIQESAPKLGN